MNLVRDYERLLPDDTIDINWNDDPSHSCPYRYFTPNFTFAFVILKVIYSGIILFRFAFDFCVNGTRDYCLTILHVPSSGLF